MCDRNNGTQASVYYIKAGKGKPARCSECGGTLTSTVGMVIGGFALLLFFSFLGLRYKPKKDGGGGATLIGRASKQMWYVMRTFTPHNKLKIVIGFYMIATKVDSVYSVSLPSDVRAFLDSISITVSLGLQGFAMTPLECVGAAGYLPRLIFWMVLPPIAMLAVIICVAVHSALVAKPEDSAVLSAPAKRVSSLLLKAAPWLLSLLFVLYPIVTTVAFESFPCHEFANGRGWLVADVSIECRTPAHDQIRALAWTAVLMYPVGVWVVIFFLLLWVRGDVGAHQKSPLTKSLAFLYREYETSFYWSVPHSHIAWHENSR